MDTRSQNRDPFSAGKEAERVGRLGEALQHRALVPVLIVLYLLQQWFWPEHAVIILLVWAVMIATRAWEVRGGLVVASICTAVMGLGVWRETAISGVYHPFLLDSSLWLAVVFFLLAGTVGNLMRRTRAMIQANEDLRQAQQRLAALHTIALCLSTTLDVSVLMEKILEQLGKLWGYDHGAIVLVDDETGDLVVAGARGYVAGVGHRIPAGQGIAGAVIAEGKPICVGDVTKDPRYVPGLEGARSELAVPLLWEGKTLGVLNVESRLPNAYGSADVALLSTVAEQAAAAIGNARLHQQTQRLALTDPHTGLYNYRHFQDQVAAMVRDSQLTGQPFSLILLDIDFFKRVNDTYGHPTGDAVLAQVARVLRESCRQGDLSYRYGGEEFAITLPGASHEDAVRVAERIRDKIGATAFYTKSERPLDCPITVSMGVASYPRDGITEVDLLLAADTALYQAKSAGRNRVVISGGGPVSDPIKQEPA